MRRLEVRLATSDVEFLERGMFFFVIFKFQSRSQKFEIKERRELSARHDEKDIIKEHVFLLRRVESLSMLGGLEWF
jgi:hypothetical protein